MSFQNPHKNDVRFVLTPSCLKESSYHNLHYSRIVVSNTDCVVFFFVLCTLCCQFFWIVHFWLPLRYIFFNFSTTRNRNVILRIHIHFNKLQEKKKTNTNNCVALLATSYDLPPLIRIRWESEASWLAKIARRIWRYQRGNQNPSIEEEQTTQWPKEKVQKDK